jgi:hypothetical protein
MSVRFLLTALVPGLAITGALVLHGLPSSSVHEVPPESWTVSPPPLETTDSERVKAIEHGEHTVVPTDERPSKRIAPPAEMEADLSINPRRAARHVALVTRPTTNTDTNLTEEVRLITECRATLSMNPARSLAAAEEHRGRFPDGLLAEEREVLAIEALSALGMSEKAIHRAAAFGARHPESPYRMRIRAALGRGSETGP